MTSYTDFTSQIRDLLAAHVHYGDSGRIEDMVALYAPDGVYKLPNDTVLKGAAEMTEVLGQASSGSTTDGWGLEYMRHHLTTSHIEIVDDTAARSDSYFVNITNKGVDHWGRWHDQFCRRNDGRSVFTSRQVIVEGSMPNSWFKLASGLS